MRKLDKLDCWEISEIPHMHLSLHHSCSSPPSEHTISGADNLQCLLGKDEKKNHLGTMSKLCRHFLCNGRCWSCDCFFSIHFWYGKCSFYSSFIDVHLRSLPCHLSLLCTPPCSWLAINSIFLLLPSQSFLYYYLCFHGLFKHSSLGEYYIRPFRILRRKDQCIFLCA